MFAPEYMGRKRCFRILYSAPELFALEQLRLRRTAKAFEGATPRRFRPTYAEANVGHPVQTLNAWRENRLLLVQLPLLP